MKTIRKQNKYDKAYIDEQIEIYGYIEEYEDSEIVCPYCGHIIETTFDDYENGDFQNHTYECWECEKEFLVDYEVDYKHYFKSKRMVEEE